jgi:hypothetical protein
MNGVEQSFMTHFPTIRHYIGIYSYIGKAYTDLLPHKKIFYRLFLHICIHVIHICKLGHNVIVPNSSRLQYSQRIGGFLERIANLHGVTHCHTFYLEM